MDGRTTRRVGRQTVKSVLNILRNSLTHSLSLSLSLGLAFFLLKDRPNRWTFPVQLGGCWPEGAAGEALWGAEAGQLRRGSARDLPMLRYSTVPILSHLILSPAPSVPLRSIHFDIISSGPATAMRMGRAAAALIGRKRGAARLGKTALVL